jgi:SAM-dependent methyltransferase
MFGIAAEITKWINVKKNIDTATVVDFGKEWQLYDQSALSKLELEDLFNKYFSIFPWHLLTKQSIGFDLGCGSGRWAKILAPKVGLLHCIDPSAAINIAKKNLSESPNCVFHHSGLDDVPLEENSMDFGYSLGVLHHVPNTQNGISICVKKLKVGAPFLLYLYYRFDNRPFWFILIWKISDVFRKVISKLPFSIKSFLTNCIALFIYLPLIKVSKLLDLLKINCDLVPLSQYKNCSFYTMQTDALDRFGTKLEQRFTKEEIRQMMASAGLGEIKFSENMPFWCAVGIKK